MVIIKQLKQTEIAYLAGFFDGEGCVLVVKDKTRLGNPAYRLRVLVTQINPEPLILFKEAFGGLIQYHGNQGLNHRDKYTWELHSKQAFLCISALLPYLTVKKHEVKVAQDFYMCNSEGQGRKKTPERIEILENFKVYLSDLKHTIYPIRKDI